MSRTDVHRPWPVQRDDPHNRHRLRRFQTWSTEPPELIPLYNICGCPMCTQRVWYAQERRRARYAGRREARRAYTAD